MSAAGSGRLLLVCALAGAALVAALWGVHRAVDPVLAALAAAGVLLAVRVVRLDRRRLAVPAAGSPDDR